MLKRSWSSIAVLLAAFGPSALNAASRQDTVAEAMKERTVQIRVERENRQPELGSGVFLCSEESGRAYIVTAYHVLFEREKGKLRGSRGSVERTTVQFYKGLAETIVETRQDREDLKQPRFELSEAPARDLLLLRVELGRPLLPPPERGQAVEGELARAVGYALEAKGEKEWVELQGDIRAVRVDSISHQARLEEGFSGGPLFDRAGGLLGINIEYISADDGGSDRDRVGLAVPLERVREAFGKLIPSTCWGKEEDVALERATPAYRLALRQLRLRNWAEAQRQLCAARQENRREGGSVHLEGMRYTTYLPTYHLGVALYKQKRWTEAYWLFRESEIQAVIQADPSRFRKLERRLAITRRKRSPEDLSPSPVCPQENPP